MNQVIFYKSNGEKMKYLLLLPLLFLCACQGQYAKLNPSHFGIKPSFEVKEQSGSENVYTEKIETSLDWNF